MDSDENTTIEAIASHPGSGKNQIDIILLDFTKAFDKVPHRRLLHKLDYYIIRGETLTRTKVFLKDQMVLAGKNSSQKEVLSGIP